jgi:hypothetical protein
VKSRIKTVLCGFSLASILSFPSLGAAQSVELFGALSVPVGDFGDDIGSGAGMAKLGYGVGLEALFPIGASGLYWSMSPALLINPIDGDEMEDQMGGDINVGSWMSIPLLAGLRFGGGASPNAVFYVTGQAGIAIHMAPDIQWTAYLYDGYDYIPFSAEQNLDSATSFAFCVGAGVVLNERLDISIRYYGLGTPELNGEIEVWAMDEWLWETVDVEQPVSVFAITVGVAF